MIFNLEAMEQISGMKVLPCKDCGKLPDVIQTPERANFLLQRF